MQILPAPKLVVVPSRPVLCPHPLFNLKLTLPYSNHPMQEHYHSPLTAHDSDTVTTKATLCLSTSEHCDADAIKTARFTTAR